MSFFNQLCVRQSFSLPLSLSVYTFDENKALLTSTGKVFVVRKTVSTRKTVDVSDKRKPFRDNRRIDKK